MCSRSCDGGFEHHMQTAPEEGIKIGSGAELHHEGGSTCNCDEGGPMSDNKSTFRHRVKTEGGAEFNDEAGGTDKETSSSMLLKTENGKDRARIADVMRALFGDSDEEPGQYEAEYGTDQGKNNSISPEHKLSYEGDLESEGTVSSEHTQFGPEEEEEEKAEDKLEGESKDKLEEQSIGRLLVVEFPNCTPLADPSQGIYRSLLSISKSEKVASSSVVSDPDSSTVHGDRETTPMPETEQFQQKCNDKEMTSNHNHPDEHMWPSEAEDVNLERQKDRQTKKRRPRRG
ncbi:uncharacterized protein LOC121786184 isoform X1 [Salvia splendens]|uniref:uncharacterized protein LOC121786184 isoform X1 n=1 Tax=Salvia splendens TaxID=180675 RepID=UPI001C25B723|nr:uncharacterized protein LOC121786184 isoform X1 [Salvia splendens]